VLEAALEVEELALELELELELEDELDDELDEDVEAEPESLVQPKAVALAVVFTKKVRVLVSVKVTLTVWAGRVMFTVCGGRVTVDTDTCVLIDVLIDVLMDVLYATVVLIEETVLYDVTVSTWVTVILVVAVDTETLAEDDEDEDVVDVTKDVEVEVEEVEVLVVAGVTTGGVYGYTQEQALESLETPQDARMFVGKPRVAVITAVVNVEQNELAFWFLTLL
jgi:hypothetical protein